MRSFRVVAVVGALLPGAAPEGVLRQAGAAAAEHAIVEARDLRLRGGAPEIWVRFTAEDEAGARRTAWAVVDAVTSVAHLGDTWLERRDRSRWTRLGPLTPA